MNTMDRPMHSQAAPKVPRVLVVDDDPANLEILSALMRAEGYEVATAADGLAALEQVAAAPPDLILLDIVMPERDGYQVCRQLKQQPETRLIPIVLITSLGGEENDRLRGIEAGADDFLAKPVSQAELKARARSLLKLKAFTDELEHAEDVLRALAQTIAARDRYTGNHCGRVAATAVALAKRLGLPGPEVKLTARGAFLHDLGKVGVPDAVLLKRGPLTPAERAAVEQHPAIGADLLRPLRSFHGVAPVIRYHHERLDGSGYPDGLAGDAIPLPAQIVGLVDVYEALTSTRPYRAAFPPPGAARILQKEAASGWRDGELVKTFLTLTEEWERKSPPEAGCTGEVRRDSRSQEAPGA
jgi:putative two-component system response regulator